MAFFYRDLHEFPNTRLSDVDNIRLLHLYNKLVEKYTFIVNTTRELNNKLHDYINSNNRYVDKVTKQFYLQTIQQIESAEKLLNNKYLALEKHFNEISSSLREKDGRLAELIAELSISIDSYYSIYNKMMDETVDMCRQLISVSEAKTTAKIADEHVYTLKEIQKLQEQIDTILNETATTMNNPYRFGDVSSVQKVIQDTYNHGINGGGFTAKEFTDASYITAEFFDESGVSALSFYTNGREKLGYFTHMFFKYTGADSNIQSVLEKISNMIGGL